MGLGKGTTLSYCATMTARPRPPRGQRPSPPEAVDVRQERLHLAHRLFREGLRADKPLDAVVADFLKRKLRGEDDALRLFVVDTAHGMWRSRRLLEAIAAEALCQIDVDLTGEALCALYCALRGALPLSELPFDPARLQQLVRLAERVEKTAALDVVASMPPWLVPRIAAGPDGAAVCRALSAKPPQSLRVNTLRTTREAAQAALAQEGIETVPAPYSPDGLLVKGKKKIVASKAWQDGLIEIQDEGSQLVGRLCAAGPGQIVVDGCAGAGGKTLHLAATMQGKGTVYAFDVHHGRLAALQKRAARAGAHNIRVQALDEGKLRKRLAGRADIVLVDAPCSGSGVLRRNPDIAWTLTKATVSRLAQEQRTLLHTYAPLVRPGGCLVYATCSLLEEENEVAVRAFLAENPSFVVDDAAVRLRAQGIEVPGIGPLLRLDPFHHGTDGFFAAVLQRS